ncbi:MAG: tetratricopeptide repeat protein [Candidatus Eremiobacteraeota bacterium]|nr:tetratricopeptide repeat protein [Candidatus Eremiobacteraeota bacterium]
MRFWVLITLGLVCASSWGCSGGVKHYIVSMRSHQGDLALATGNLQDAQLAYRLALQLAPNDAHARDGLAQVQIRIAAKDYQASKFEDALAALAVASKYDPQSVRVAALRSEIEQARVNRQIVLSNYPTYSETGRALRRSYIALKTLNTKIISSLLRFDYTYDAAQLTQAIRTSLSLQQEVARNTSRLISYRQLVQAGAPTAAGNEPLSPGASLLPLP